MEYLYKPIFKALAFFSSDYRLTTICLAVLCLVGCGGDGSSSSFSSMTASASLGQIRNAEAVLLDTSLIPIGEPVELDATGRVIFDRPPGSGPFIVVVSGDADAEYFDEAVGNFLPFPAGQQLRAIIVDAQEEVAVTLFTELAVTIIENEVGGLPSATRSSVDAANELVRDEFLGGIEDILEPPTIVGSNLNILGEGLNDIHAAMLAAFAELASGQPTPALAIMEQLREDMRDGMFDSRLNGVPLANEVVDLSNLSTSLDGVFSSVVSEFGLSGLGVDDLQAVRDGRLSGQWRGAFEGTITVEGDSEQIPLTDVGITTAEEVPSIRNPGLATLQDELIADFVVGLAGELPGSTLENANFSIRSETLEQVTVDFSGRIRIPSQFFQGFFIPEIVSPFSLRIFFDRVSD